MTILQILPHGRASAHTDIIRPGRPDYKLITSLRSVRADGDAAMAAAEEYDPDFPVKLSNCTKSEDLEALLSAWLAKRLKTLEHTQAKLRQVWLNAQAHPNECP